jgi:LPS export ABC transporter protein LptC
MSKTLHLRRLLALFIILSAATLGVTVFRYFSNTAHKENRRPTLQSSVDLALKTIHFTESSGEGIKWELFAAKGEYDKSAELSTLQDIRFVIKQVERYGNIVVTAREGQFAHASKKVTLAGDVLAKNDNGATFETSRITYDSGRQFFKTVEKVRMIDGGLTVEGKGMEMSLENKEARIMSRVTATILPGKLHK